MSPERPPRILFVCLGNICRSPLAEGVARARAAGRGLSVELDSAGTGDWHVGEPPDRRMQRTAAARGLDLSGLRARQVQAADAERFDLIVAMDAANLRDLHALLGVEAADRIVRLLDYHPGDVRDVPDPYFGGDGGFDYVFDLVDRAVTGLLDDLA